MFSSVEIAEEWFIIYDDLHYSLENKLISLNKSLIQKLAKNEEWKNDYIIREFVESYGMKE
ncbi:MAG: hypothetical protein ACYC49_04520 [Ignavibacteriaceae bacterium]